jgi:VCBS repeat-containing protein
MATLDEDAPQQSYASVLANDQDPNGQPLTAVLEQGPSHGTLSLNADGSFVYRPDADYNGSDSFITTPAMARTIPIAPASA